MSDTVCDTCTPPFQNSRRLILESASKAATDRPRAEDCDLCAVHPRTKWAAREGHWRSLKGTSGSPNTPFWTGGSKFQSRILQSTADFKYRFQISDFKESILLWHKKFYMDIKRWLRLEQAIVGSNQQLNRRDRRSEIWFWILKSV